MNDTELALLKNDMEEMKRDIKELKEEVRNLLELWRTATGMLSIMKWLVSVSSALAVGWAAYKGFK